MKRPLPSPQKREAPRPLTRAGLTRAQGEVEQSDSASQNCDVPMPRSVVLRHRALCLFFYDAGFGRLSQIGSESPPDIEQRSFVKIRVGPRQGALLPPSSIRSCKILPFLSTIHVCLPARLGSLVQTQFALAPPFPVGIAPFSFGAGSWTFHCRTTGLVWLGRIQVILLIVRFGVRRLQS